jgi:hypothetical protein
MRFSQPRIKNMQKGIREEKNGMKEKTFITFYLNLHSIIYNLMYTTYFH